MFFAKKILGSKDILYLGNLNAKRDWGHAKDYTEMQWKILQQSKPDDYVIATGKTTSIREFVNLCCKYLKLKIIWNGKGIKEKAYLIKDGKKELIIKIDKKYYRPLEIDYLKGNPKKALKKLNYKLKNNLKDLVKEMIDSDIKLLK
jgi:GDPmannose 4,6-dehydratase